MLSGPRNMFDRFLIQRREEYSAFTCWTRDMQLIFILQYIIEKENIYVYLEKTYD